MICVIYFFCRCVHARKLTKLHTAPSKCSEVVAVRRVCLKDRGSRLLFENSFLIWGLGDLGTRNIHLLPPFSQSSSGTSFFRYEDGLQSKSQHLCEQPRRGLCSCGDVTTSEMRS